MSTEKAITDLCKSCGQTVTTENTTEGDFGFYCSVECLQEKEPVLCSCCDEVATVNSVTGTEHDGLCEECYGPLTVDNLTEGDFGFYCSDGCLENSESDIPPYWKEDFHADG